MGDQINKKQPENRLFQKIEATMGRVPLAIKNKEQCK